MVYVSVSSALVPEESDVTHVQVCVLEQATEKAKMKRPARYFFMILGLNATQM